MTCTDKQLSALRAICDAFLPEIVEQNETTLSSYWSRKPSDLLIPERIIDIIRTLPEQDQKDFKKLLNLISLPILGVSWGGPMKGAQYLTHYQLEKMLSRWAVSLSNELRDAFGKLKKLTALLYYGDSNEGEPNPNWQAIQYQGYDATLPVVNSQIPTLTSISSLQPEYDAIIIGSGASGGVVAAKLSKQGKKVLIIEKGNALQGKDFNGREVDMMFRLFEKKGLLTSSDGGVTFLAGSCLGGGTTINWAASLRTPKVVLEEWATLHGNTEFAEPEFEKYFEEIEIRNKIHTNLPSHNSQNRLLYESLQKQGYNWDTIPRNCTIPDNASEHDAWKMEGFTSLGDAHGIKQSVMMTFLKDAVEFGADILVHHQVEKLKIDKGLCTGVLLKNNLGEIAEIKANKVILCAGAIHTPALLLKSGIKHKQIGKNLYIHPAIPISGIYDEKIEGWYGPMMTVVTDSFANLHQNFGFRLECPPLHPGIMGVANAWNNGKKFKESMLEIANTAAFLVLVRDMESGSVEVDAVGNPILHYKIKNKDLQHLITGIQEATKAHFVNGAKEIIIHHNDPVKLSDCEFDLQKLIKKINTRKWQSNYYSLFSAHQMGTCRMGKDSIKSPVNTKGQLNMVGNIYVADASVFPSASGVNPMLTIQAVAAYISDKILETW